MNPRQLGTPFIKSEILFGRKFVNNNELTDQQWNAFVGQFVTPLFPSGLTMTESKGQMLDGNTIVKQRNFGLTIIHPNTQKDKQHINKIINIFKRKYPELQAMKTQHFVSATFYNRT